MKKRPFRVPVFKILRLLRELGTALDAALEDDGKVTPDEILDLTLTAAEGVARLVLTRAHERRPDLGVGEVF